MIKNMTIAVLVASCFALQGCSERRDIVSDVWELRKENRYAKVDISSIVQKYILVGTSKSDVEIYLKSHGFKWEDKTNPLDDSRLVARYYEKSFSAMLGFYDEIRVIVEFENKVVKNAEGWLFFHAW